MVKRDLPGVLLWWFARGTNKLAESGGGAVRSLALRRARLIGQKGYCISLDPRIFEPSWRTWQRIRCGRGIWQFDTVEKPYLATTDILSRRHAGDIMEWPKFDFNVPFRLLLTFNATSLLVIVFLVQKGYALGYFFPDLAHVVALPNFLSYILYLCAPILLTGLSLALSSSLGKDEFKSGQVDSIDHANNSFLPSYLGYFFVALSVPNWETLIFVYGVLFVFTYRSQALYFNPLFLLYGYEFYNITTTRRASIFLISRAKYKLPTDIVIEKAFRINDYTFIEKG
ncbi:hypothetical protein ACIP8I_02615 [Pseudomonas sp. NPDC088414]|uniref:hypothetical protein n=1 Tax=Pseudomonas sp. NPDC088414 TaxID=3364454 RepID=UPI00382E0088